MSNDLFLKDNQSFTIELTIHDELKKSTFTCRRFIGSGEVVDVFEVIDHHKKSYALKIPKDPSRTKLVQDEFETLNQLEKQHQLHNSNKLSNTPTGNYFVRVRRDDGHAVQGLLMPFLSFPQLADVYRDSQNRAGDDLAKRLDGEYLAWYAALQYLDLIQTQLQIKKITTDRKRDTFLWDNADQRLIVMDWNVMDNVSATSEGDALYNFAQVWFTMFTQLQPHAIPTFWDDERWDNLTLSGRDILLVLLRRDLKLLSEARKRIHDHAMRIYHAQNGQLDLSQYQAHLPAWEARRKPLTRKVVEEQFMPLAYLADIVRRVANPQQNHAQQVYDELHQAIEVRGEVSDRQLSVQRNLEKVRAYRESQLGNINEDAFLDLRLNILNMMSQHDALKTKLYALETAFQTIPNDFHKRRIQAREMRERLDDLRTLLATYGIDDTHLQSFYGECDMIDLAYQADDALATGDFLRALDLYQTLEKNHVKYPLERYTHLTHDAVVGIIALLKAIENTDSPALDDKRDIVKSLRQTFVKYVDITVDDNDEMFKVWLKRWKTARLSSQLTVYDKLLLEDYIAYGELILKAHQEEYVQGEASHHLAYELGRLRRRIPEAMVKRSISQSKFFKTLQKRCDEAFKINREQAEHRHLYVFYQEEAYYLYQLICIIEG